MADGETDSPALPYLFRVREEELPAFSVVDEMSKPEQAGILEIMISVAAYVDEAGVAPEPIDRLNFMWGFSLAATGLAKVLRGRNLRVPILPRDEDSQIYYGSLVALLGNRERRERVHNILLENELPLLKAIARDQKGGTDPEAASFEAGLIGGYAVMSEAVAIRLRTAAIRWD